MQVGIYCTTGFSMQHQGVVQNALRSHSFSGRRMGPMPFLDKGHTTHTPCSLGSALHRGTVFAECRELQKESPNTDLGMSNRVPP